MTHHSTNQAGAMPNTQPLAALASDGQHAFLTARLLEPGLALLAPFAQITEIKPHQYAEVRP